MRIVDNRLYTTKYYLTEAEGGSEYPIANKRLIPQFYFAIKQANIKEGMSILDVGFGRGEILFHTASIAEKLVGVDYSEDAVRLANNLMTLLPPEFSKKVELICDDINNVLPKLGKFDRVFLMDVVEHMYPEQLEEMYNELIKNHLNHGAIMIIHTPIADTEEEKHYFLPNTMQKFMHVNINSLEEHTKYFKDVMEVERIGKRFIKAVLR